MQQSVSTKQRRTYTVVDLYCGCGGVTTGLKRKGWKVVAAVDKDPVVCKTYKLNHPEVHLYQDDIKKVDPKKIRRNDLNNRDLDLLVVCAPCQPFSTQNRSAKDDGRSKLILEAIRFAAILRPRAIFFENVPGLASELHSGILHKLKEGLANLGYVLSKPYNIDAADYGVPQRRIRCVLFASRSRVLPSLPTPTTPEGKRVTVRKAIGHLKKLDSGELHSRDPLHKARKHRPEALTRLEKIPKDGGSRAALPSDLVLPCHQEHKGHMDVYGRMQWSDVAPTLTTGCTNVTKGRFAHPEQDRAITAREAALLQSFPRKYQFAGSLESIAAQIGNAVPVRLIEALSASLKRVVRKIP
jgi:DNA (cytosine-5)-methyltransferase 1